LATDKATAIVGASVARAMATPTKLSGSHPVDRSVLILGGGEAAQICETTLSERGFSIQHNPNVPSQVERRDGKYTIDLDENIYQSSALILTPKNAQEEKKLLSAFDKEDLKPRIQKTWGGLETHRPGVYLIDHKMDPYTAGAATAARVAAWLGRIESQPPLTAVVNSTRCRACGTCGEICEFGAPEIIEENEHWTSWIDPAICTGCGTCVAHCPSGAITAGYSTDAQIEAMLSVLLAGAN
jgi:heterodisulfide reductase subunit A-like polyferredoxin